MEKFIVLAARRSGTTLFLSCLNSHPQVYCHKHVFDVQNRFRYWVVDRRGGRFHRFRTASTERKLQYMVQPKELIGDFLSEYYAPIDGVSATGVRLAYVQAIKHPEVLDWAADNGVGIIHLVRQNALKTIISVASTKVRRVHHSTNKVRSVKVTLPPRQLLRRLERLTNRVEANRALLRDRPHIEISYESFVASRDTEARRVLEFLDVDPTIPLTTDLVKLNPDSLQEIIENYNEVQQTLAGTQFAHYLA